MARRQPGPAKHADRVKIAATPAQVAKSLFAGKPKPRRHWRYLQDSQQPKS